MVQVLLEALVLQEECTSMSLNPETNYALVTDGKIDNIIVCDPDDIVSFSEGLEIDGYVELTDENYFNVYSKARVGDWVNGTSFVWSSWTKNEDGTFTPPVPMPTDGKVYEWRENVQEWEAVTPYPSWNWDPVERVSTPPFPSPDGVWSWNEEEQKWDPLPEPPNDGQVYSWNPITSSWEPIVE